MLMPLQGAAAGRRAGCWLLEWRACIGAGLLVAAGCRCRVNLQQSAAARAVCALEAAKTMTMRPRAHIIALPMPMQFTAHPQSCRSQELGSLLLVRILPDAWKLKNFPEPVALGGNVLLVLVLQSCRRGLIIFIHLWKFLGKAVLSSSFSSDSATRRFNIFVVEEEALFHPLCAASCNRDSDAPRQALYIFKL